MKEETLNRAFKAYFTMSELPKEAFVRFRRFFTMQPLEKSSNTTMAELTEILDVSNNNLLLDSSGTKDYVTFPVLSELTGRDGTLDLRLSLHYSMIDALDSMEARFDEMSPGADLANLGDIRGLIRKGKEFTELAVHSVKFKYAEMNSAFLPVYIATDHPHKVQIAKEEAKGERLDRILFERLIYQAYVCEYYGDRDHVSGDLASQALPLCLAVPLCPANREFRCVMDEDARIEKFEEIRKKAQSFYDSLVKDMEPAYVSEKDGGCIYDLNNMSYLVRHRDRDRVCYDGLKEHQISRFLSDYGYMPV